MKRHYFLYGYPLILLAFHLILSKLVSHSDLFAGILFIIFAIISNYSLKNESESSFDLFQGFAALAIGFSYTTAIVLMIEALPYVPSYILNAIEAPANMVFDGSDIKFLISFILIEPIAEELAFRHGLQKAIKNPIIAITCSVLASALFCALRDGITGLLSGLITGFIFALLYQKTGQPAISCIAHIFSSLAMFMSYLHLLFITKTLLTIAIISMIVSIMLFLLIMLEEEENEIDE